MKAVEIEQAVSELAEAPFDVEEFPYAFLEAFGNKSTTLKKLRSGTTNKSDLGGLLQRNNIHIKVCSSGVVGDTLTELRNSPATAKGKVKIILATDGEDFQAEDLNSGEIVVCDYAKFGDNFWFFLPLAGISSVKQAKESQFDIKATRLLNRFYVQLLNDNPDWGTGEKREEMNHFMARLIFCFFAEDTDIFKRSDLFTNTIDQMSESDASNTHEIIMELFRAMNTPFEKRDTEKIARWANELPYVNGGLFAGSLDVPKLTRIARSYLIHIGGQDWKKINPDIFGSMIQAVADDEERGELGMHYTSVPNILKVLNPLFLDDLREQLESAGDNGRKLLNLRNRLANIRVFDPACGSGNFLVIAYKEMRAIEAVINQRRGESDQRSAISVKNFRGIEIRNFSTEVARLALIIAEYQCDVLYRGQKDAIQDFLPLRDENWIVCANALRIDWLSVFRHKGSEVHLRGNDLFFEADQKYQVDFENEGGETYICGNPPYAGSKTRDSVLTEDLGDVLKPLQKVWKDNDYVAGWLIKSAQYINAVDIDVKVSFVTTNSICQGQQVSLLWPLLLSFGLEIGWAHRSFRWSNLASNKAAVSVIIVGLRKESNEVKYIFEGNDKMSCEKISPYLTASDVVGVSKSTKSLSDLSVMKLGNMPYGKALLFDSSEKNELLAEDSRTLFFIRNFAGGQEFLSGKLRFCLWIEDDDLETVSSIIGLKKRIDAVKLQRSSSSDSGGRLLADRSHQFRDRNIAESHTIVLPRTSSELRGYIPVGLAKSDWIFSSETFALYDAPLWNMALIASRIHLVWIATVCGKMKTDFRYSNTLGWNTFPVPTLTEKNKGDLTRCAENILLAREAHFPKTIADLYDPEKMPANLREAHEQNDETLERIYIGRRFKNDTERLEKLFELYTKMTTSPKKAAKA